MDHFLLWHNTNFMNNHGGRETYEVHVELVLQISIRREYKLHMPDALYLEKHRLAIASRLKQASQRLSSCRIQFSLTSSPSWAKVSQNRSSFSLACSMVTMMDVHTLKLK